MGYILDLPRELLLEIAEFIDPKDLRAVRLVCKDFCTAAIKPFALTFFTKRVHSICPRSFEALADMAVHETFGPYIDTVIIQAESLTAPEDVDHHEGGKRNAYKEQKSLEKALQALKQHRSHLTIGVRAIVKSEEPSRSRGGFEGHISGNGSPARHGFGWREDLVCNLVPIGSAFKYIYGASRSIGFEIDCVDITYINADPRFYDYARRFHDWLVPADLFDMSVQDAAGIKDADRKIQFQCLYGSDTFLPDFVAGGSELPGFSASKSPYISYTSSTGILEISRLNVRTLSMFLILVKRWQPTIKIEEIVVERSDLYDWEVFDESLLQPNKDTLQVIKLDHVSIATEKEWTEAMRAFATITNLRHCSIVGLMQFERSGPGQHLMNHMLFQLGHDDTVTFHGNNAAQQIDVALQNAEALDREAFESTGIDYDTKMAANYVHEKWAAGLDFRII